MRGIKADLQRCGATTDRNQNRTMSLRAFMLCVCLLLQSVGARPASELQVSSPVLVGGGVTKASACANIRSSHPYPHRTWSGCFRTSSAPRSIPRRTGWTGRGRNRSWGVPPRGRRQMKVRSRASSRTS